MWHHHRSREESHGNQRVDDTEYLDIVIVVEENLAEKESSLILILGGILRASAQCSY